jgi:hypothetical protein
VLSITPGFHHFLVRKSGSTLQVFFDGVAVVSSSSFGSISNTSASLKLGSRGGSSFPLNGSIDEVAIWNRALTDAEVAFLASQY